MSKSNVNVMRIVTAPGSQAEKIAHSRASVIPAARAPGFPTTPKHDLIFHGGKTLPDLSFFNFFVGGSKSWVASDVSNINDALDKAMSDAHLNNVVQQYFHGPLTSEFLGSQFLTGAKPPVVTQGDVEDLVRRLFTAGNLNAKNLGSTVFNFMLPSGTILNDDPGTSSSTIPAVPEGATHAAAERKSSIPKPDEGDSTNGLGGYHGSVHAGSQVLYYAIGVFSEHRPDGSNNGIPVFDASWKNVVATFYHELNEARTDPDVEEANRTGSLSVVGWTSRQGEEIGDFPVSEANPLTKLFKEVPLTAGGGTVPVQFLYSNAVHGPEGPIPHPH